MPPPGGSGWGLRVGVGGGGGGGGGEGGGGGRRGWGQGWRQGWGGHATSLAVGHVDQVDEEGHLPPPIGNLILQIAHVEKVVVALVLLALLVPNHLRADRGTVYFLRGVC